MEERAEIGARPAAGEDGGALGDGVRDVFGDRPQLGGVVRLPTSML